MEKLTMSKEQELREKWNEKLKIVNDFDHASWWLSLRRSELTELLEKVRKTNILYCFGTRNPHIKLSEVESLINSLIEK